MKRDFDLIRSILLDVEAGAPGEQFERFEYHGYKQAIVDAHVALVISAGFVDGQMTTFLSGELSYLVNGLTWEGHDFLESMKDPDIWDKAKKNVIGPVGGVALSVLKDWLKAESKKNLGI